jgi:hypothetical protein
MKLPATSTQNSCLIPIVVDVDSLHVMAGPDPAIVTSTVPREMAGSSPAMTIRSTSTSKRVGMRVKTEKPAGISPPANHWRSRMLTHLLFLLLIVVILGLKVKIIIERP